MDKIKILFFASNPDGTSQLMLDEEIRSIKEKIRLSEHRDVLELISFWAVRPDDLLQELNTYKPTVVHFSGHGNRAGEIVLMDNNRQIKPVSSIALKMLFTTLKDNIRVVVLNACYSQIQAKAIAEVVDCVIGMNNSIGDIAAITFASAFYRAIGFGRSVLEAFEQGKTALLLQGIPEETTPQLITRQEVDASKIILIETTSIEQNVDVLSPMLSVDVDKISNFEMIDGNKKTIYTTAGEFEGKTVYGRGHRILISLINQTSSTLTIYSVRLRIVKKEPDYPKTLRYSKMQMTLPHSRLPIEVIQAPIYIQDIDSVQTIKEIGEGKIYLEPKDTPEAIHQIVFTTEVKSPGLWIYQLEVEYLDPIRNDREVQICKESFVILLRGR